MTEEKKSARGKVSEGIKQGIGVLSAFKDALEETINEAREKGDLSSDRAKEVMKDAMTRAQEAAEGARERLDFVAQRDFDGLSEAVEGIKNRLQELEAHLGFGASAPADDEAETSPDEGEDSAGDQPT